MSVVTATGASGTKYTFEAYLPPITWNAVPVIYMFAYLGVGGWKVLYIGQSDDAKSRLPTHDRWTEALKLGATHVLARVSPVDEQARKREERDLILSHDPHLNTHHRPQNLLGGFGA